MDFRVVLSSVEVVSKYNLISLVSTSYKIYFNCKVYCFGPPLSSSGQSSWLLTQRSWLRFPALPNFLSSGGSGAGSTQPL
jgi:hypothetical protein